MKQELTSTKNALACIVHRPANVKSLDNTGIDKAFRITIRIVVVLQLLKDINSGNRCRGCKDVSGKDAKPLYIW